MTLIMLLVSLFISVPAIAQDLGGAGAISGFGQGMGRGFESMQSGIIQQGLMQQRFENERKLREQQYQYELEMQRARYGQPQQQRRDQGAVDRHTQESIRQEADRLNEEAADLNKEANAINSRSTELMKIRTENPTRYQEEIVAHHQRNEAHLTHLENYMERYDAHHKRYGLTPPSTYQREAEMTRSAIAQQRQIQAATERYIQESAKVERVTLDPIRGLSTEEILNSLRPGWRTIIGAAGSDAPYRQWLKRQPKAYQKLINDVVSPEEINESINEFLATQ